MIARSPVGASDRNGRRFLACLVSIALAFLPGCSGPSKGLPVYTGGSELPPGSPGYPTEVQIKYLGAGGVVMKRGADVIVTAPFYSNPSIPRVAFGEIRARPDQIDHFLGVPGNGLAGATAILVGHAHYDHLMDVPYVKSKYLPQAKVYGSDTMRYTLLGDKSLPVADIVSVEAIAAKNGLPGKWTYATPRLRFMAIESEHAPIILHLKFFEGTYDAPLQEIPTRASAWREGRTFAYLIDFLGADGATVDFRIHYQDAASNWPVGAPPKFPDPQDQHPVDLAIVCMPGFDQVENYPNAIVTTLKPRFVVIIHWENFFALLPDDPRDLRLVPNQDADVFLARLRAALGNQGTFMLPAPGAWMRFSP